MGFYEDQVLPRVIDVALGGRRTSELRARVAGALSGEVVEIGFGSGRNVPHYPPEVRRVQAVDPATVGRKLAAKRVAASPVPVEYVGLDGEELPLPDDSVDNVLITWTMCTIPHLDRALAEVGRVLRPGGELHFLEHGLSPDPRVARHQRRLTPLNRRIAGGCHLDRPIEKMLVESDFHLSKLENYYVPGPKALGYMYEGVATPG